MKVLSNPWAKIPGYNCFGCSQQNPIGLKMNFTEENEFVVCEWNPDLNYQGYHNILHGGIQSTLMDEIASWTVFVKADKGGVTYKLEVKFKKPVYINNGKVKLKAKLLEVNNRIAKVNVELFDSDDQLCSEAIVTYFIVSNGRSDERLIFPGKEAFYQ